MLWSTNAPVKMVMPLTRMVVMPVVWAELVHEMVHQHVTDRSVSSLPCGKGDKV